MPKEDSYFERNDSDTPPDIAEELGTYAFFDDYINFTEHHDRTLGVTFEDFDTVRC